MLVTGATGYVGGRLVPRLLEEGYRVRVLVRGGAERLRGRPWASAVDVVAGDALNPQSLVAALQNVDAAYYLIHSMGGSTEYDERDRRSARNFGVVAALCGVRRIIYLGGLGNPQTNLSDHLRSRQETGDVLRQSGVPVTEFRAGVIVGSGSLSFEMLRHLTERVPIMIGPHWMHTRSQPIGIRNVLQYLIAALTVPESAGRIIEIGGADVVTYADMIQIYARERRLRRLLISVPAPGANLSAPWVHWITPVSTNVARPLIDSLRNEMVVTDTSARELFPDIEPLGYLESVQLALERIRTVRSRLSGATHWPRAWATYRRYSCGKSRASFSSGGVCRLTRRRKRSFAPSPASADNVGGPPSTGCGKRAASWTGWWAA